MNRIFRLFSLVMMFAIIASLVGMSATPASAQSTSDALVQLRTVSSSFNASQDVMVHVIITNPNPGDMRLLSWNTPANGVQGALFTVTRDGAPVNYLGALYKRAAPTDQDYITLAAGKSLEYDVNLSQYYSFAESGNYMVKYNTGSLDLYAASGSGKLVSNQLALYVTGRPGPVQKVIVPEVVTGDTTFNSCSGAQQTALLTARNDASTYANNGKTYFNNNRAGSLYQLWFGIYNASRWALPKNHYSLISNATDTATIDFDCTCTDPGVYAYVYPGSPYDVYLCGAFWNAPATGTDSKAGTLIHEMSHFTILGGTDDYVYGQTGAKALAISNPEQAVMNADNHEYFVENTPATVDNAAAYTLGQTSFNFGDQPAGSTSAVHAFTVTSRGDINVSIGQVSVSGEFSLQNDTCSNNTFATGNTCTFGIAFAPASTGAKAGTVTIPSNAVIATSVSLAGNGTASVTPPTVVSITRADINPTTAASVDYTVTFSESVTGVGSTDFSLTTTGTLAGAAITAVNGSGSVYTVTVSTGTGSGTLRLDIPNTATIVDLTGNPLAGLPYIGGEAYIVPLPAFDKISPAIDATNQSLSPTLSWDTSDGATSYEYCYSSAAGPCTQWHSVGASTSVTLSELAPNYTYYWQARAVNAGGSVEADDGTWWSFTTTAVSACTWPAYTAPTAPTFGDVPMDVGHWNWVERLANSTITAGCGAGNYCPFSEVVRAQMAIFLLRGKHCGSAYAPPAVGASTGFADVPLDATYAPWVKQLAAEGVTAGCGNGNFCPQTVVNRAQMAIFLLRARHGSTYSPPAVGATTGFADVPLDATYAAWVKQLAAEGVTAGCGGGNFCPLQNVNRAQMATFLVRAFGLP